jgi:hypothetical protein
VIDDIREQNYIRRSVRQRDTSRIANEKTSPPSRRSPRGFDTFSAEVYTDDIGTRIKEGNRDEPPPTSEIVYGAVSDLTASRSNEFETKRSDILQRTKTGRPRAPPFLGKVVIDRKIVPGIYPAEHRLNLTLEPTQRG